MSTSSTKTVTLKSSDGEIFVVEESVAVASRTIKNMIENDCAGKIIPIQNVSGKILFKVIDYCRRKLFEPTAAPSLVDEKEIKAWEYEFVRLDANTLHDLNKAAQFLGINSLMDLTFQAVTDMITGIVKQEIRKKIRTEKSYTKQEEKKLRKRNRIPNDPLELSLGKESRRKTNRVPNDPLELSSGKESRRKTYRSPNDPLELSLGKEPTEEEVSELWKQYSIVNDPPEQIDFSIPNEPPKEVDLGKEFPEYTKAEESDSIQKDNPMEIDLLKNFGKESTKAEEKAWGKRKIID